MYQQINKSFNNDEVNLVEVHLGGDHRRCRLTVAEFGGLPLWRRRIIGIRFKFRNWRINKFVENNLKLSKSGVCSLRRSATIFR